MSTSRGPRVAFWDHVLLGSVFRDFPSILFLDCSTGVLSTILLNSISLLATLQDLHQDCFRNRSVQFFLRKAASVERVW